jgi:uncharacterized protein YlxW (UPF0749 family)
MTDIDELIKRIPGSLLRDELVATLQEMQTTIAGYKKHFGEPVGSDSRMTWQDKYKQAQQRIEELEDKAASFEGSFNAALKEIERLEAALNYIGDPQNGMVDLAAYARKAIK